MKFLKVCNCPQSSDLWYLTSDLRPPVSDLCPLCSMLHALCLPRGIRRLFLWGSVLFALCFTSRRNYHSRIIHNSRCDPQSLYSEARSLVAWLAVEEVGHCAAEVARFLGISRMGVQKAVITCPPSRAQGPLRRGGRGGSELKGNQVSLGQ